MLYLRYYDFSIQESGALCYDEEAGRILCLAMILMGIFNLIGKWFLSLRATAWLMGVQLLLLVAGAVQMPAMKAYENLNNMPLMAWVRQAPPSASWWLICSAMVLGLLSVNTLACSVESLIRKRGGRHWLLIISPQIIHIGFLFMLLGHLLSAMGGFQGKAGVRKGSSITVPTGHVMTVQDVRLTLGKMGYPTDFSADVAFFDQDGTEVARDTLAPNQPAFFEGFGYYIKDVKPGAALIEVHRDPGTPWALGGGGLFTLGTIALLGLKIRREK
ncbi:cytochrome c biogenesis protein ResB [Nitrospirota bacterium]